MGQNASDVHREMPENLPAYPARIDPLTSLRFFAALAVFAYHIDLVTPVAHNYATVLLHKGHMGVDFFFILSGFILTHIYYPQMIAGSLSIRNFFVNRIARVYPLHLIGVAAAFAVGRIWHASGWSSDVTLGSLSKNLLLIQAWGYNRDFSFNQPAWSISAEWFAYLVFPLLLAAFARVRPAVGLFIAVWFYITVCIGARILSHVDFTEFRASYSPVKIMPEFVFGMALYLFGMQRRYWFHGTAWTLAITGAFVVSVYLGLPDPATVPFLGLLIVVMAENARRGIKGPLSSKALVYLGEISYAIYMIHFFVLFAVWSFKDSPMFWPLLAVALPVTVALAAALHHAVEIPCRRLVRNMGQSRTQMTASLTESSKVN